MGDNIADLSSEPGVPPVPPKTYQWEDVRRQKLEGRYPWTHLYKPPFDLKTYEKTEDHEYEPVIPMDTNRKTPPPYVKITPQDDNKQTPELDEPPQDKHHLCLPIDNGDEDENDYEDDDDDTEEITAAELQSRLEEKYFRQSPGSSKHEYELTETRSVSPAMTDDTSRESSSFQDRVHSKTDSLKQKFKNLKDHISKDHPARSPGIARKKDEGSKSKPVKKNKFNFRKHTAKSAERSDFRMPQAPRLSFTSLTSFSRSRSSSVKERERKRSQSSETDSQKKKIDFHFGTYPRIFSRKKKTESKAEKPTTPKLKPKSAPASPSSRRSPFPQRWISKFTDSKKEDKKEEKQDEKKSEPRKQKIVQESIFISLHEDATAKNSSTSSQQQQQQQPVSTEEPTTHMKVDDKNFIFISLHEERFPEKLEKAEQRNEEAEIDTEIRKAETTRKFANLLRRLETDRKIKSKRNQEGKFADDKPEPVVITDITNDEEDVDNSTVNLENSVEIPDEPQDIHTPTEPKVFVEETKPEYAEENVNIPSKPTTPKSTRSQVIFETKKAQFETPAPPTTPKTIRSQIVFETKKVQSETSTFAPPHSSKDTSKFEKLKEIIKEKEKIIKFSNKSNESKEKDSKKFQEFKENLLKETEKIGTLKNKIKNYFAKENERNKEDFDDKHIYEEFDNVEDTPPKEIVIKRVAINESQNQQYEETVPQKIPRKKLKKIDSDKESKESLSAFDDATLNDIVAFDEQQPMTKTYINESLQEVNDLPIEPEFNVNPKHFKSYEKALEKTKSYSSIEIENNLYSASNSLAQLETPVPPSRPSRTRSLQRAKHNKPIYEEKENNGTAEASQNYNTFPMVRPDKPRRKFRKPRTYSNSTNSEVKSVNELEDATISQNIVNSKQLSVSFLPLISNSVGEPIINYTLRETSSMIHLNTNIVNDPPMAPKRRRSSVKDGTSKYNTLPNKKYCSKASSKTSLAESETCNGIHVEGEDFEFVDDANSLAETPPRRPIRKRSSGPSFIDDDRTSREIESLPSEKSYCDSDSKDINGYSVIKSVKKSHSQPTTSPESNTAPRRKSRRLSDFFTLPRIHAPTNYVSPPSTLPYERRLPSPSRPPRKGRTYREPVYTNEENINVVTDFGDEEELNFNLATVDDDIPEVNEKDEKNLQTDEVMERMKIRPLPPPPRPIRKPRDEKSDTLSCDYSQVKKNTNNKTNNLNQNTNELKIINIDTETEKQSVELNSHLETSSVVINTSRFENLALNTPSSSGTLNVITAQRLNVSELNVAKLSINEIESSKLTTSTVDTDIIQTNQFKSERGHLIINSVELSSPSIAERLSPVLQEPKSIMDNRESGSRDVTPSSDEVPIQEIRERTRISSMIPEVGSDEESTSAAKKVVKPSRRKPVRKEESPRSTVSETNSNSNQPTLAELMCQILQICHSSVGQAIHSLLEQVIPEDREKRNEVQAAIWVITIIIAGCLMLGLQSNEKIVHHHHWDFHFPPPH